MKTSHRKCLGYPAGIDCLNPAGTKWTPFWCESCDEKRRAYITARLNEIKGQFQANRGGKP